MYVSIITWVCDKNLHEKERSQGTKTRITQPIDIQVCHLPEKKNKTGHTKCIKSIQSVHKYLDANSSASKYKIKPILKFCMSL